MARPYPWYFVIDARPVKVDEHGDLRAMDLATGAMHLDPGLKARITARAVGVFELSRAEYIARLDEIRRPILERYASMPLQWQRGVGGEVEYRCVVEGHELGLRMGEFPDEGLYQLRVDGDEIYEIDDWPSAWRKPPLPGTT